MEDVAAAASLLEFDEQSEAGSSVDSGSRTSGSSPGPNGSGTGVFIPACILDGSAMTNPAIAAKFPRRQRRGSSMSSHSSGSADTGKQLGDSASNRSAEPAAAAAAGSTQERGQHNSSARNGRHQGSHSTSAKNPFAATPKNIRQQQLLCNLVAAADSFTDPSAGGPAPAGGAGGGASRAPSLDYGGMPPPFPGRPSTDRPSLDMSSMSGATSRTSLESWGYLRGRNSCDINSTGAANRASMESYTATSMRSSMDRASCWSGRPSVDSTFSAYGPVPPSPQLLAQQQQQQQQVAATAAAAAAAAVAARASFEAALPPTPAGNSINRMGMWQPGRSSCDVGGMSPGLSQSAFVRYSLDSAVEAHTAAAAAAAGALQMEQQARSLNGLLRYDSNAMSSGSMDSAAGTPSCCPASPANPAELAAAAAAINARRNQVSQLQQLQEIIDSMAAAQSGNNGGINAETAAALATLTAQGVSPDTAAVLLMQAQQNAAAAAAAGSSSGNGGLAPEAVMFQQHLQQIMQANQMAAQAAAASKLYAASAAHTQVSQQRQQNSQRWQRLGYDAAEAELYQQQQQAAPLAATFDAGNLQQQLEMLQRMQL